MVAACTSLFVFAVSAALLPAVLLRAAADLLVSTSALSWAVASQFAACFLATILGGVLSDRHGMKPVLLVAAAALTLGAALWAMAQGLLAVHAAAVLMGLGGGILESLGSALLAALYPNRRTLVLNLSQAVYCAGAIAGPAAMAVLLPLGVGWRVFFAAETGLGVILFLLYRATPMPPASGPAEGEGLAACFRPLRVPSVLLLALALFCYVLAESGVAFYLNLHLQRHLGAPECWAVLGISAFWAAMLLGRLACSLLPDRWFSGRLIGGLAVLGAVSLAGQFLIGSWQASLGLFAVSGLLMSGTWPSLVALAAQTHPQRTGSVIGGVIAIGSLGVVAAPVLASLVSQQGGGILFFPLLAVMLLLLIPLLSAFAPPSR